MKALALAAMGLALAASAGCSSAKGGGTGGAGGSEEDGPTSSVGPSSSHAASSNAATTGPGSGPSSSSATTSSASTGGGDMCGMLTTYDDCYSCECAKDQAGCDAYETIEDDKCYCGPAAPCLMACQASYCANGTEDATCQACDDGLPDTCFDDAATQCDTDPTCSAFLATTSVCDNLP